MEGRQDPLKLLDQYYKMLPSLEGLYQVVDEGGKDLHQLCREQRRSLNYSSDHNPRVKSIIAFHKAFDDQCEEILAALPRKRQRDLADQFKLSLDSLNKRRKNLSCTELPNYTE